jgi:hypothetical protein
MINNGTLHEQKSEIRIDDSIRFSDDVKTGLHEPWYYWIWHVLRWLNMEIVEETQSIYFGGPKLVGSRTTPFFSFSRNYGFFIIKVQGLFLQAYHRPSQQRCA